MLSLLTIIKAFNSFSGYLDDLLNIDTPYFEQMVSQINKANSFDTEAPFLNLDLLVTNGIVSSKIMINRMILILNWYIFHFLMRGSTLPFLQVLWCIHFATYSFCESMF